MKYGFKLVVIFIVLGILGIAVLPLLQVDLNPKPNDYSFTVRFSLPQSSPDLVEHEATSPLENIFSTLSGLKKIYSVSNYNGGVIELTFDEGADLEFKRFEISSLIRQTYPQLNPKVSYPIISEGNRETDQSPLLVYQVKSTLPPNSVYETVKNDILPKLSRLNGVKDLKIRGAGQEQITLFIEGQLLQQYGITPEQVESRLRDQFSVSFSGLYKTASGQYLSVEMGDVLRSKAQLDEAVIHKMGGVPIRLSDIGQVLIEPTEPESYFRVDGQNALVLTLYAEESENRIRLADEVSNQIALLNNSFNSTFEIIKDYDDSEFLRTELAKIYKRASLSVIILSLFIFLINRNGKYLFVLFAGLVLNICLTSLCAWFFSIDIHIYTIAGLTIAFGLIIDNSIVMIDHLYKKKDLSVFNALLGASLTTISAVMLVFFLPEEEKKDLLQFSQIIAIGLFVSLFVALFFTPSLFYLLKVKSSQATAKMKFQRWRIRILKLYQQSIFFLAHHRRWVVVIMILSFGLPIFLLPSRWENHEWYNSTIGSDMYQETTRPVTDVAFGGALRLFVRNVFEKSGYRSPDKTRLYVTASMPHGSTVHQLNDVIINIENYLSTVSGVSKYVTRVSSGQQARIIIEFGRRYENGALPYQLKSRLIARSLDWGGVEWNIYGVGRGFSNANSDQLPSFRVLAKGYNYNELDEQANQLAEKLLKHKRIQKVNTNERLSWSEKGNAEYIWHPEAYHLASHGLTAQTLTSDLVFMAKLASPSFYLHISDINFPVYMSEKSNQDFSLYDLKSGSYWKDSTFLDFKHLGELELTETINAIHKEDRQYLRVVGFEYFGSYKFGNAYLDEILAVQKGEMPLGYTMEKLSWEWNWGKAKRQYGLLLILIVAIYFICAILFENLKQPILIIVGIPVSFIGLFLTFSAFDFYFDQGGYAAFVLLGGLVVNAGIFIVNDLNSFRSGNFNRNVIKAVRQKAQPIMLTILSTCFGLVPFLIEGQNEVFWFSLAVGTIGGLIFSVLAVFIILPVLLMAILKEK